MNKLMIAVAVAAVVVAGCSSSTVEPDGAKVLPYELRMSGAQASEFGKVLLVPNAIQIWADGVPVRVLREDKTVNLATVNHAERIATFELPEGAKLISFRVELGAAGGFEKGTASGWVDTRGRVLEFDAAADWVRSQERAGVAIDVARSLQPVDEASYSFVPKYRVF